jgi:hypothetical protein
MLYKANDDGVNNMFQNHVEGEATSNIFLSN